MTGGAGFIGSALCRHLVRTRGYRVINVDKLTYAADVAALETIRNNLNYRFELCDIADEPLISSLLQEESVSCVVHLAAETHVDRSIRSPGEFIETNIVGTYHLLEAVLRYWRRLDASAQQAFRFHHVSTDEVFGDVAYDDTLYTSDTRYRPSSPYSASKAASDHLGAAWFRTYGLPVVTSHSSNNYGPGQLPDKLIPMVVLNALEEKPIPLYGTGANVRDWLYVEDHVRALELVMTRGRPGEAYQIAERGVRSNLQVAQAICALLDGFRPRSKGRRYEELITFVSDRPGHDRRYAIDPRKAQKELGWTPTETFETGLAKTVRWYLEHVDR